MSANPRALTSVPLTRTQVRSMLLAFEFPHVNVLLDQASELGRTAHLSLRNMYGTGITVRYIADGDRWYVYLNDTEGA